MFNEQDRIKKILIDGKEVEVIFYNDLSNQKISKFLKDVDHYYVTLVNKLDIHALRFIHALIVIKHFTNYKVNDKDEEEFLKELKRFTDDGLLDEFAKLFDKKTVQKINEFVITHFLLTDGDIPEYLNFGNNKNLVKQLKEDIFNDEDDDDDFDDFDDDDGDFDVFDDDDLEGRFVFKFDIAGKEFSIKSQKVNLDGIKNLEEAKKHSIDSLLDEYNHYNFLFNIFKDVKYKERTNHIIQVLKGNEIYNEKQV